MDIVYISLAVLGAIIWTVGFFLIGRFQDPRWKAKAMDFIFHKTHYVINVMSDDMRRYKPFILEIPNGVIKKGGKKWVVVGTRICREGKTEEGIDLKSEDIKRERVFDEVGMPTLFVSEKDFKALGFKDSEDVRPDEVDAIIDADVQNEIARKKKDEEPKKSNTETYAMIAMVLSMATLVLVYFTRDDLMKISNAILSAVGVK